MGSEHYANLIEMVSLEQIELTALCDIDAQTLQLPETGQGIGQINLLLQQCTALDTWRRLRLLHEKMLQICPTKPTPYTDYRSMLESEKLDGVIIATPNHLHREMAEYALGKNINVFCEKPLATRLDDCDAMIRAERESDGFLQVGFHMRYRKLLQFIKKLIDEGRIGAVKKIWCQEYRGDWNPYGTMFRNTKGIPTNWRHLETESGGSIVEKLCHDFDLAAWWMDSRPCNVSAFGNRAFFKDRENIDQADIIVTYENGAILNISLCMFAPNKRFKARYIGVIGENGVIDFDEGLAGCTVYHSDGLTTYHKNVEEKTKVGFHHGNATFLALQSFLDNIVSGKAPAANSTSGREAVALSLAAQQSIYEGRTVSLISS